MEKEIAFKDVLAVFANYGFRKASMEDLARAAGVSRQTLYNRFRTKQAVLDWAVSGFVEAKQQRAIAQLNLPGKSLDDRLLRFYSEWMGVLVPLLHSSPHGSEIMDRSTESLARKGINTHLENEGAVANFLAENGVCQGPSHAREISFLLGMSAKGLLFKCRTSEEFEAGMKRIVRTALAGH